MNYAMTLGYSRPVIKKDVIKNHFVHYPAKGQKLIQYKTWKMDFEDKLETLHNFDTGVKVMTIRDILGGNLIIANFETRPSIKKCMLLELVVTDKGEDGFGKASLRVV